MSRWWVSWWVVPSSRSFRVPFRFWISGSGERPDGEEEWSLCALIDAESEEAVWPQVEQHFPGCRKRFCEEREADWEPGDRFPRGECVMRSNVTAADWFSYEAEGGDYVPMGRWGKDHWSTFAYLETRTVDHGGVVDNAHMRCNTRLHREFATDRGFGVIEGGGYPTRLKDGMLDRHDDFSILEDCVAAGLITAEWRVCNSSRCFGNSELRVKLTEFGAVVAAALRLHKAAGGKYADFVPPRGVPRLLIRESTAP